MTNPIGGVHAAYGQAVNNHTGFAPFDMGNVGFGGGSPLTPAGRTIGRFNGNVFDTLKLMGDNSYVVMGRVKIAPDAYSWKLDGRNFVKNLAIATGALTPNYNSGHGAPNLFGTSMMPRYNKEFYFMYIGHLPK